MQLPILQGYTAMARPMMDTATTMGNLPFS
jgi:hypothetical protein